MFIYTTSIVRIAIRKKEREREEEEEGGGRERPPFGVRMHKSDQSGQE